MSMAEKQSKSLLFSGLSFIFKFSELFVVQVVGGAGEITDWWSKTICGGLEIISFVFLAIGFIIAFSDSLSTKNTAYICTYIVLAIILNTMMMFMVNVSIGVLIGLIIASAILIYFEMSATTALTAFFFAFAAAAGALGPVIIIILAICSLLGVDLAFN